MAGCAADDLGMILDTQTVEPIHPGGVDPEGCMRSIVARKIYWHPPLVMPDSEALREPGAAWTQRMQHPRADIIAANPSVRLMYKCQIWDKTTGVNGFRLPACDWCGIPTGCFCSGIAPTDQRPGFDCRIAVCTICSKLLDLCVNCATWSGIPLELDERINLSGIQVRAHEKPGPAVTAMLLGKPIPNRQIPRSWLQTTGQPC